MREPCVWRTPGAVQCLSLIGLFVCVYLFSKFTAQTAVTFIGTTTHQTQIQLQITKQERTILQQKIDMLENIEYERGTLETAENK